MKAVHLVIGASAAGRTAASLLRDAAAVSHSVARGMLDAGLVTLNGRPLKDPARRLETGDVLDARFDPGTRYRQRPTASRTEGFTVRVEDDHILVVDKAPGLITVPAPTRPGDSLADRVVAMYAARGFRSPRVWVVHRIDRFTSGLVLFARTEAAFAPLDRQFRQRTARREYIAICEGIPVPEEGRLESFLHEDPVSLKVRETADAARGRRAVSHYRVEETLAAAALLRIRLETGRRNQIRVQMAGSGHPLVGDRAYGRPSAVIPRVALHAARLGFIHPATGRPVSVESPLPPDMKRALRVLRHTAPA